MIYPVAGLLFGTLFVFLLFCCSVQCFPLPASELLVVSARCLFFFFFFTPPLPMSTAENGLFPSVYQKAHSFIDSSICF